jgi:hypothetical protein
MAAKKSAPAKSSKSPARSSSRRIARETASAGDQVVTIDRRRARRTADVEDAAAPAAAPAPTATLERRKKVQRRRQIDPTTCERDYSVEEVAFMNAMDDYKRKSGRMFPTCSEVLEVIRDLGYVRLSPSEKTLLGLDKMPDAEQTLDAMNEAVDELLDVTL